MIDDIVVEAIRAAFPSYSGDVNRQTTAAEVPGWDSFGHVQLIFELEDRLGVAIDTQKSLECKNVGELLDLLAK